MTAKAFTPASANIRDRIIRMRTAKGWAEWFAILDGIEATKMEQGEIVAYLAEHYEVRRWYRQAIARTYLMEHGLRRKNLRPDGYAIVRSITVAVPVEVLYKAWTNAATRKRWLPDPGITIRKSAPNKSLRITWIDGKTHVDAIFGHSKNQGSNVIVQHRKLPEEADTERMKAYWTESLERLKAIL
ncbi:MAG: SRPBCC domain-containing protein [Candidatus Neomarinimicrobiota bacterium]